MTHTTHTHVLATLAATVILLTGSACNRTATPDIQARSEAPALAARPNVPQQGASLEKVGHYAEDLYDRGKQLDWPNAGHDLDALREAAAVLRVDTGSRLPLTLQRSLAAVEAAVSAQNGPALMNAANELTREAAQMQRAHSPRIPVDVALLDYYGRELEIAAGENDLARLVSTRSATVALWTAFRATVITKGGSAEAARFDQALGELQRATTAEDFRASATRILDEVDLLEGVFTR